MVTKDLVLKSEHKQTQIGIMAKDWEKPCLNDKGYFKKGKGIKKDQVTNEGFPCIRYGEIYTDYENFVTEIKSFIPLEITKNSTKIKEGDLLFAGSGETVDGIGKCVTYLDKKEAFAGGDIIIYTPNEGDSLFLSYLMNHRLVTKQKSIMGQGISVVHIYAHNLKKIIIPFPKPKEQSKISKKLFELDELISTLNKILEKKKNIRQGIIQNILTGKKRLSGYGKKWKVEKLKQIVKIPITDGPHLTPKFLRYGIPFLSVNNLINNQISLKDLRYISKQDHIEFSKKCKPQKNDILLGKAASVGSAAIANFDFEYNIWSPLALIRINNFNDVKFIYYCFQSKEIKDQIKLLTNSSSQGNLGMVDIEKLEFKIPERNEQRKISKLLEETDLELEKITKMKNKYIMIKNGMMEKLLTGEIRLA
jgi:type I restriction enzyme, S subunit